MERKAVNTMFPENDVNFATKNLKKAQEQIEKFQKDSSDFNKEQKTLENSLKEEKHKSIFFC